MITAQEQYVLLKKELNERQWRIFLATEALKMGYGRISRVSRLSGADPKTIRRGIHDLNCKDKNNVDMKGRIRLPGGGRKKITVIDPTILSDLDSLLEPKGDPMSFVKWTTKSLAKLQAALEQLGHSIEETALSDILHSQGFSLRANKKTIEGKSHPDRDQQFRHINKTCETFTASGNPIISVDCKKKELLGNFKNNGKEWQPEGSDKKVNVYDFSSLSEGKAVPYGVYDTIHNAGFVNVGTDHDTASFAVESIRRWWKNIGSRLYPNKHQLLITCDSGGSNGARNRLWKRELQRLVNETNLTIAVCHLPPATSKWNKIEHRLFSYISVNWRARPLTSLETIIELITHTTTKAGLTIHAILDMNTYPTGIKISDKEMAKLNIERDPFHGEWNYTIRPQSVAEVICE